MRLVGSAALTFFNQEFTCQIAFDLSACHINVWLSRPNGILPLEQFMLLGDRGDGLLLRNICVAAPFGRLRLENFKDFFVVKHVPSIDAANGDSDIFVEGAAPVTQITLQPRRSQIEFSIDDTTEVAVDEIVFQADTRAHPLSPFDLDLFGKTHRVTVTDERVIISPRPAEDIHHEAVRLSLGILSGGPSSIRSLRAESRVTIDMAPHSTGTLGRLWEVKEHLPEMLRLLVKLLGGVDENARRHRLAAHFYTYGLGDRTLLEHRIVSLYTALEVLDCERTLSKASVSSLLDIDVHSADLVCRVRNALVHNGLSIGKATEVSAAEIRRHVSVFVVPGLQVDHPQLGAHYYFWLASLLAKYWQRAAEFHMPVSDYASLVPARS